jgi:hypothetical protein
MQEQEPCITGKWLGVTVIMNQSQFWKKTWTKQNPTLNGSGNWVLMTKGRPEGFHNLGLWPDTIHSQLGTKRWHNTLSWSHRMMHELSRAGTRTKTTASSSPFQHILARLVSMPGEG